MVKTLFIVISEGRPARDVLRTDVFRTLQKQEDLRIVIFLPGDLPEHWKKEFSYLNVVFEKMERHNFSLFRRKIFDPMIISLLYAKSAYLNRRFGTRKKVGSLSTFIFWFFWSKTFGNSRWMKRLFRYLEIKLYPDRQYAKFFDKHNPDLVFTTSILAKIEVPMLKEAQRRGIKTVSIPKSWDTFDKRLFRIKPDKMIVQNQDLKDLAMSGQDFEEDKVTVVGFPQFDVYSDRSIIKPREEFLRSLGIDPAKKVLIYGCGGLFGTSYLDEIFSEFLCKFINSPECAERCSLIIRMHFAETAQQRFGEFRKFPDVYVDDTHQRAAIFGEIGDPSRGDSIFLANLIYHSDVMINPGSTLSLDAACYDKPAICTGFGNKIMEQCLEMAYYKRVLNTGGVRLTKDFKELAKAINDYLRFPELDSEGRELLRKKVCAAPDGKVGVKIANFLLNELGYKADGQQ